MLLHAVATMSPRTLENTRRRDCGRKKSWKKVSFVENLISVAGIIPHFCACYNYSEPVDG